ncbi:MAG: BamA/TamA family outer membrane protein [Pseudobdellovibrionaceae bacterium]
MAVKYSLSIALCFFFMEFFAAAATNICPNIVLEEGTLKLNANEKILVCGTDKDTVNWREIPIPQAQLQLRSILQNLGYLNPRFERHIDTLYVWAGPQDKVSRLIVENDEHILRPEKKRKIIGYPLMPAKLDEVESWANLGLRTHGYACSNIVVEAHAWDGTMVAKATLSGKKTYGKVLVEGLGDLNQDVLDRYQPFKTGDTYDIREPQIMTGRMLANGLFQSAYFVTTCLDDVANIEIHTSVGKPKILHFGIGASTEELPFIDLAFRNARLDNKASFFTTTLHASPRKESFIADSELYFFPGWHRTFFGPRFELLHRKEVAFETNSAKIGADLGRSWDQWHTRFVARGGPTLNYVKNLQGVGPNNQTYSSVEGSLSLTDHIYEATVRDQFEGWTSGIFYRGRRKGLGSEIAVDRLEINFKHLWNIGEFSPPLFVLGSRLQTITVDSDELTAGAPQTLLTTEERVYLGGDDNLRGFPRGSINNGSLGFLTSAYLGFELRLVEQLPYHLQPFLLFDSAKVGNRRYTLAPPLFTSEGVGLRWASPFGTLRGSIARGHVLNGTALSAPYPEQWVYFLSFGQEF